MTTKSDSVHLTESAGNAATAREVQRQRCAICDAELSFRWTDTHGVGACSACAAPYTVYHYESNVRMNKPPELALSESGVALAKRYWSERKRKVFPGAYDFTGVSSRRGNATYSGATEGDMNAFNRWMRSQPEHIEAQAESS